MLLFLILAHNSAVGASNKDGHLQQQFFKLASFIYSYLFQKNTTSIMERLKHDFPITMIHFNHFIKLHNYKSVNKEFLLLLMTQGASVLYANNHI